MNAKIKSSVFIDALHLQLVDSNGNSLKAELRDETGCICSSMEKSVAHDNEQFVWSGLNDLPYGTYTLQLSQGEDSMEMQLVKRV